MFATLGVLLLLYVILLGHSFGTYIAAMAAQERPDLYEAYVGIGQMSDSIESERNNLEKNIMAAEEAGDIKSAEKLKAMEPAITERVTKIEIPVYFVMGKYEGMTLPEAAEKYLQALEVEGEKSFVLFEESAHYPQFEEEEAFFEWMKETFSPGRGENE